MSGISAAKASSVPVIAVVSEAAAVASGAQDASFGQVLSGQMERQGESVVAQPAPAQKESVKSEDASGVAVSGDLAQAAQAMALPWLQMLQQPVAQTPVASLEPVAEDVGAQDADASSVDMLLQVAQQSGALVAGVASKAQQGGSSTDGLMLAEESMPLVSSASVGAGASSATDWVMQSASVAMETGKNLPLLSGQGGAPDSVPAQLKVLSDAPLPPVAVDAGAQEVASFADVLAGKREGTEDHLSLQASGLQVPLLQSAREASSTTAVPAGYVVQEAVGDARWGDAVAQRVSLMLGRQEQQMEMQLNPPHLGPMEVRLTMGGEQASVLFTSQNAAVREALNAATPRLTALLADQGIQLVNVQVASDSLNQQAQDQSRQQASAFNQADDRRHPQYGAFNLDTPVAQRVLTGVSVPVARSGVSLYV